VVPEYVGPGCAHRLLALPSQPKRDVVDQVPGHDRRAISGAESPSLGTECAAPREHIVARNGIMLISHCQYLEESEGGSFGPQLSCEQPQNGWCPS
jgi:hypothetical protein